MVQNRVKELLRQGQPALGHWLSLPSPGIAELMSGFGMDWLVIDTEHGPAEWETVENMARAMKGTQVVPLVRVVANDPALIKKAFDRGAFGVVIPLVNTAEQGAAAVMASRFPPEGIRGVAGSRANRYGADLVEYVREWNREVLVVCQLETAQAVENAEAIAAVSGIDVLFIGPNDLSANLGILRQFQRVEFTQAVDRILKAAQRHSKVAGIMTGSAEETLTRLGQGFRFISTASDTRLLAGAVGAIYEKIRNHRA